MHAGMSWLPPGATAGELVKQVHEAVKLVRPHLPKDERSRAGGHFCLADIPEGLGMCCTKVGQPNSAARVPLYAERASNKALLLARWAKDDPAIVSGWQLRNPAEKQYAGAIRARHFALAFSGMTEHGDEAVCLVAAVWQDWLTLESALGVAQLSGNRIFEEVAKTSGIWGGQLLLTA